MAEKLDPKETISILELTVSHMWSIAALVEVLERKGTAHETGKSGMSSPSCVGGHRRRASQSPSWKPVTVPLPILGWRRATS